MGAQEHTEKVLKNMHMLLAKAEPYGSSKVSVIINREEALNLLKELNVCMEEMLEECELTEESREKIRREDAKEREEKVQEAEKKAEDVYAASIIYSNNALDEVQRIMAKAVEDIQKTTREMQEKLADQQDTMRQNQSELKSQLNTLHDTAKYMKLIEEENTKKRIADGNYKPEGKVEIAADGNPAADTKPTIRINEEYFRANGIPLEEDGKKGEKEAEQEEQQISSEDLDAEYFGWQGEQEKADGGGSREKKPKKSLFSLW